MDSFKEIPEYAPKSVFGKILEVANVASLSPEERLEYDQALKHYRDYNNTMHTQYRQGKEEGLAEGLAKGKSETIFQMLQNMQKMGINITTMAKIAKLSEEEVTNILQE
jgi:predicted transposase/invertase (TIGR01784 family)